MWITGLFIVIWDFFVLPYRFIRDTFGWLSKIGAEGSVSVVGDPEFPFLNWTVVAGRAVVTILALLGLAFVIIGGFIVLADSAGTGIFFLLIGPLYIWLIVWFYAISLEFIYLFVRIPGHLNNVVVELKELRNDLRQR